jgi:hypothetical protein
MIKRTIFSLLLVFCAMPAYAADKSDSDIKKQIIAASIANYPSNCPCPYNRASNGSQCGKRSAYSKPGGYSPICYEGDVTPAMIESYKKNSKIP